MFGTIWFVVDVGGGKIDRMVVMIASLVLCNGIYGWISATFSKVEEILIFIFEICYK